MRLLICYDDVTPTLSDACYVTRYARFEEARCYGYMMPPLMARAIYTLDGGAMLCC